MRSTMTTGVLEPLSVTDLTLADSTEDIRGLKVFDRSGSEFGKIDDVFIDPAERRARFVAVKSGDILGIGGQRYLLPVELLTFGGDHVQVNETAERITQGPQWDGRELTPTDAGDTTTNGGAAPLILDAYAFYDVREPFWSPAYTQPMWKR
jgi:sporulation protein YlmC with PRC-barrel domain